MLHMYAVFGSVPVTADGILTLRLIDLRVFCGYGNGLRRTNKGHFIQWQRLTTSKGYVYIFVCLVTRAIHIEIVSDLTSKAFLAPLPDSAADEICQDSSVAIIV